MKKLILLGLLAALAGCNTIAGIGEDISGGARATQNALN
ncbi:MAG: entericidin EcnA/B family protein [Paracoccaceae bacterium]|jgi:predicted small secreted protein|nr:entericidin EcnA/B family protein [Frigidibacter sp. RF13]MCY1125576.1 entericidin EcnA/B family protein [Frigidibacter sp. RF13]